MKNLQLAFASAVLAAVAAADCGGRSTGPGPDAGTQPDGGNNNSSDAATTNGGDAGPIGSLGQYCSTNTGGTACPSGYVCITTAGATGGQCAIDCTASATACPTGSSCVPAGGNSFCFQPCTTACPAGQACAGFSSSSSYCLVDCTLHMDECGTGTACDPSFRFCTTTGSAQFGGECGAGGSACAAGLTCLQFPQSTYGFCSQSCATTACPTSPAGASCFIQVTIQGMTENFCGFHCADGGATPCPPTLTCAPVPGSASVLCQ